MVETSCALLSGGIEVLRGIQVAKQPRGESRTLQLFFSDDFGLYRGEKGVNFAPPAAESLLGGVGKGTPINRAEGLESFRDARDSDGCDCGLCTLNDVLQQPGRQKGDIDREDQVQIFWRRPQCGMNSCQRPTSGKEVFDGGSKGTKLPLLADDANVIGNGTRQLERPGKERSTLELDESLVSAHAGTLASCKDEGGEIRFETH
jgi:hypothetical protein